MYIRYSKRDENILSSIKVESLMYSGAMILRPKIAHQSKFLKNDKNINGLETILKEKLSLEFHYSALPAFKI
jgi:hypothetical protein